MVDDMEPQRTACLDEAVRQLEVEAAGLAAPGGVIVDQQQARRAQLQRTMDDLARKERRFVDRAMPERLFDDDALAAVHEQGAQLLNGLMRKLGLEMRHQHVHRGQGPARHQRLGRQRANEGARKCQRFLDRSAADGAGAFAIHDGIVERTEGRDQSL